MDIVSEKNTNDIDIFAAGADVCEINIRMKKTGTVYRMFIGSPINMTIDTATEHTTYLMTAYSLPCFGWRNFVIVIIMNNGVIKNNGYFKNSAVYSKSLCAITTQSSIIALAKAEAAFC